MSKTLKGMIADEVTRRLEGVTDLLLVDMITMDANTNVELRKELAAKNISVMMVKNSLARRATDGTPLAPAFDGVQGSAAIVWGAEDVVSLAKEVTRIAEDKKYAAFVPKGGVMDGASMTAADVKAVSKWPSRAEQLSLLVGQILGPGRTLAAQLVGPGSALASQVKSKSEEE